MSSSYYCVGTGFSCARAGGLLHAPEYRDTITGKFLRGANIKVLAALAFAWFVWPTPYRYLSPHYRGYLPVPSLLRVNRFAGHVQQYEGAYWSNPGSADWHWISGAWDDLR